MLFKFNGNLINLDKVKTIWIDEVNFENSPKYMNVINILMYNAERFQILCSKNESISFLNQLKEYKSMFYEINLNELINIKNILILQHLLNDENQNILEVTFNDGSTFTYLDFDYFNIDKILEEISKRS